MKTYPLMLMVIALAWVSVACNLSAPANAAVESMEPSSIPTATPTQILNPTDIPTEVPTQTPVSNNSGGGSVGQLPATAVLPDVVLPVVDPPGPPLEGQCVARPAQAGTIVNMRSGADLGYTVIAQLVTYVEVIGVVNDWYFVPFDGGIEAYVSSTVTKLEGDCDYLYPTPIPTRDANECYFDIPMMVGIEVYYFTEPQPEGNQALGKMATVQLEVEFEKADWYKVTNYEGLTGWIPRSMGRITGACDNITQLGYDTPICLVVAYYDGNAYNTPFTGNSSDRFGTVTAGESLGAVAKTISGWYGFDPGIAQAPNEGLDRLRWVYPNHTNVFHTVGDCDSIPTVYDADEDWDYAISTPGDVPIDGCYIESLVPEYTNYIYSGIESPDVIGVLNTYAPFVALGDNGYVIEVASGVTGWVHRNNTAFVGDACPV